MSRKTEDDHETARPARVGPSAKIVEHLVLCASIVYAGDLAVVVTDVYPSIYIYTKP